jgi:hypothetical protein
MLRGRIPHAEPAPSTFVVELGPTEDNPVPTVSTVMR